MKLSQKLRNPKTSEFLILILLALSMFVSTAPGGGVDEFTHNATAWYAFDNILPSANFEVNSGPLPSSLVRDPGCFAYKEYESAACMAPRSSDDAPGAKILNYAPVFYIWVGVGAHISHFFVPGFEDVGARIFSFLFCFFFLLLAFRNFYKEEELTAYIFLACLTPMAVFLFVTTNPNGAEIACSIYFVSVLKDIDSNSSSRFKLNLVFATAIFALSRPISTIWIFALVLLFLVKEKKFRIVKEHISMFLLGLIPAIVYYIFHPPTTTVLSGYIPIENPGLSFYIDVYTQSLELFPTRLRQSFSVLGWLDTPIPMPIFIAWVLAISAMIGLLIWRQKLDAFSVALFLIFLIPGASILEMQSWRIWPQWWQGRYSLPLICGFLFLISTSKNAFSLAQYRFIRIVAFTFTTISIVQNLLRYSTGLSGFEIVSWGTFGIGKPRFAVTLLLLTMAVIVLLNSYFKHRTTKIKLVKHSIS